MKDVVSRQKENQIYTNEARQFYQVFMLGAGAFSAAGTTVIAAVEVVNLAHRLQREQDERPNGRILAASAALSNSFPPLMGQAGFIPVRVLSIDSAGILTGSEVFPREASTECAILQVPAKKLSGWLGENFESSRIAKRLSTSEIDN